MAEAKIHAQLASLEKTAESLNRVSNSINTTLAAVEKKLIELNIGLEVWLSPVISSTMLKARVDQIHGRVERYLDRQLGFIKLDGTWCLAVRAVEASTGYFERDPSCPGTSEEVVEQPIPLMQASRQERIMALSLLSDLLETIDYEAKLAIDRIKKATKLVCD